MCEKLPNFKSLKFPKTDDFRMKIFVNNLRNTGYLQIFSFKTLQYWANAYSFRSIKLVKVFCRKNASKMSKIKLLNGYFH